MARTRWIRPLGLALALNAILVVSPVRADIESDLLQKFQQQNQDASRKVALDVQAAMAKASDAPLEKALEMLLASRTLLAGDKSLPKEERDSLRRRLEEQVRSVQDRLTEKRKIEAARIPEMALPDPADEETRIKETRKSSKVSPAAFGPIYTPVINSGGFSATPVVSADRMWVRIGIRGSFTFARPGPFR